MRKQASSGNGIPYAVLRTPSYIHKLFSARIKESANKLGIRIYDSGSIPVMGRDFILVINLSDRLWASLSYLKRAPGALKNINTGMAETVIRFPAKAIFLLCRHFIRSTLRAIRLVTKSTRAVTSVEKPAGA